MQPVLDESPWIYLVNPVCFALGNKAGSLNEVKWILPAGLSDQLAPSWMQHSRNEELDLQKDNKQRIFSYMFIITSYILESGKYMMNDIRVKPCK